jgi:uncharacterized membrane protein (UPF0127 family)
MLRQIWFLLLMLVPLAGCASVEGPWVELKGRRFIVEIADDDESRARGLMFRDSLAEDRGMLFVFEREQPLAFWMRNTRIPLDILYFDEDRRLVSISTAPPCTTRQCPSYPSAAPARFTLELNAGVAKNLGVARGDELLIDPSVFAAAGNKPR